MNQQELTKLLVDSYKQAPPFIQRFISSGALSKFVEQTQDKYKLHIDVAGRLSDEITMLMVGITDPKEFIQNLAKEALVPEASLSLIVAEINQKITAGNDQITFGEPFFDLHHPVGFHPRLDFPRLKMPFTALDKNDLAHTRIHQRVARDHQDVV